MAPCSESNAAVEGTSEPQKELLKPLLPKGPDAANDRIAIMVKPLAKPAEASMSCPMGTMEMPMPGSFDWHPGGQNMLDTARRSECPGLLFLSYHMGSDLDGKVGNSARALGVKIPRRGKMYDEIQQAVRKVKLDHAWVHDWFRVYCLTLTVMLLATYSWWMVAPDIANSALLGFTFTLYFLNVFHTRHHQGGIIYNNQVLSRLTTPLYDFLDAVYGYYPYAWWFNHHVKHHVYTNDDDMDTDVPSMWPLVRSCHNQRRLWFHVLQTFYWPFLVPFTALNFPVLNILCNGGSVFHFAAWVMLVFVVPVLLHGLKGIFFSIVVVAVAGAQQAYFFAISHAHNELRGQPTAKDDYDDVDAWLVAQIEESISYGGLFTTVLLGGINMQIEHHISPALDPPLYYYVAPEIKRISQKYGCKYTFEPTFWHAVWQFHSKLWSMGWKSE